MDPELVRKKTEKSKLLTQALERENSQDFESSKKLLLEVYEKEIELADLFDELENKSEAYHHWFSALNSAIKSGNYQIANLLLQDLTDRYGHNPTYHEELARIETKLEAHVKSDRSKIISDELSKKILLWVMKKIIMLHSSIRSKAVIFKSIWFFRELALSNGYYLNIPYKISRNPIYSSELNAIIEKHIESDFLIQSKNQHYTLSEKAEKFINSELPGTEKEIKLLFSEEFHYEYIEILKKIGNLPHLKLKEVERKLGITPYQYGRHIAVKAQKQLSDNIIKRKSRKKNITTARVDRRFRKINKSVRRKVKRVIDGDTFELYTSLQGSKIVRIADFDAPEKNKRGDKPATRKLTGLIESKTVTIKPRTRDKNGRIVADVVINRKMVKTQL